MEEKRRKLNLENEFSKKTLVSRGRDNLGKAGVSFLEDGFHNLITCLQNLQTALIQAVRVSTVKREEKKDGDLEEEDFFFALVLLGKDISECMQLMIAISDCYIFLSLGFN